MRSRLPSPVCPPALPVPCTPGQIPALSSPGTSEQEAARGWGSWRGCGQDWCRSPHPRMSCPTVLQILQWPGAHPCQPLTWCLLLLLLLLLGAPCHGFLFALSRGKLKEPRGRGPGGGGKSHARGLSQAGRSHSWKPRGFGEPCRVLRACCLLGSSLALAGCQSCALHRKREAAETPSAELGGMCPCSRAQGLLLWGGGWAHCSAGIRSSGVPLCTGDLHVPRRSPVAGSCG